MRAAKGCPLAPAIVTPLKRSWGGMRASVTPGHPIDYRSSITSMPAGVSNSNSDAGNASFKETKDRVIDTCILDWVINVIWLGTPPAKVMRTHAINDVDSVGTSTKCSAVPDAASKVTAKDALNSALLINRTLAGDDASKASKLCNFSWASNASYS